MIGLVFLHGPLEVEAKESLRSVIAQIKQRGEEAMSTKLIFGEYKRPWDVAPLPLSHTYLAVHKTRRATLCDILHKISGRDLGDGEKIGLKKLLVVATEGDDATVSCEADPELVSIAIEELKPWATAVGREVRVVSIVS
jgi:hypothetical protein